MNLPPLTKDFPGIGGSLKGRAEDFFVQEIPLYEPSGAGEHVYCEIQKVGLTTFDAVNRIGDALRVPTNDIGYAGLKDARAVTRQVLSIRGTTEDAVMASSGRIPRLTVLWAGVHLLTAATTLGMLMTMPVTTFVAVKTVTCLAITVSAIAVTILWALRTARREHLVFAAS